jgi:hypothetical protein
VAVLSADDYREHNDGMVGFRRVRRCGMASEQTRAGLLHDIGKLAVSNAILDKPGKLTGAEFARTKRHPGSPIRS